MAKEKTMFEKLQELNEMDKKNGSRLLRVSGNFVGAEQVKGGGLITMGVDREALTDVVLGGKNLSCVLLVIDKDEYDKL